MSRIDPASAPRRGPDKDCYERQPASAPSSTAPPANDKAIHQGAPPRVRQWVAVIAEVATDRVDWMVFAAVAAGVGFGYSFLLPFDYTQRISFANWRYLDARYLTFTVLFATTMAWVLTLQVHAMRRIAHRAGTASLARRSGPAGAVAVVVSLLPSFLCCSPIVPTIVGLFGLSAATRLRTTGRIQYFFATKQDWLLLGAMALLVASGMWSTAKLARARCLADRCSPVGDDTAPDGPEPALQSEARLEREHGHAMPAMTSPHQDRRAGR